MEKSDDGGRVVRFAVFEANFTTGELRKHGIRVKLQDQPFRILAMLLARPGELVTREQIRQNLWPSGTFIDFDNGLNASINRLREALADSAEKPKFVETLPRRGYRFIGVLDGQASLGKPVTPPVSLLSSPAVESAATTIGTRTWSLLKEHLKLIVAASLAIAVVGVGAYFYYFHRTHRLTQKDTIVLADFTNTTGDPAFDSALKQALTVQLQQSPFLNILPPARVREALRFMSRSPDEPVVGPVAREMCERNGIKAMIAGEISQLGSQYLLNLTATNCLTGDPLAQEQEQAPGKEQVLNALGEASKKIREKLGESLSSVKQFDAPVEQATTASLEALQAYALGEEARGGSDELQALPHYKRAVELDPNFAMAYARLGAVYGELAESRLANEYASKAFALRDRTSEKEKFYITSHYYRNVTGELDKQIETSLMWAQTYPRDAVSHTYLATAYADNGELDKALDEFLKARDRDPDHIFSYGNLAQIYILLDRFEEAKAVCNQAIDKKLDTTSMHTHLLYIAFRQGDQQEVRRQIDWAKGRPDDELAVTGTLAEIALERGRPREFRKLAQQAFDGANRVKVQPGAGTQASGLALEETFLDDFPEAGRWAKKAWELSGTEMIWAAAPLAFAGETVKAQEIIAEMNKRHPLDTLTQRVLIPLAQAAIEMHRENFTGAIEALRPAEPFEGFTVYPAYLRGQCYLKLKSGKEAASEFQRVIQRRDAFGQPPFKTLARLGLARAYSLTGDVDASHKAYQDFFKLWKDAEPDVPQLLQAKAEYAKLP